MGAGGDQENVMFLAPGVTVKLCGGPVGAGNKAGEKKKQKGYNVNMLQR